MHPRVPEREIRLEFVRSSGPGGQNVNKTASKAQLRWHVGNSSAFSEAQKAAIRSFAANRVNSADEIVLAAQTERSQAQNRDDVIRRLQVLVARALAPRKIRKKTRVSRTQKRQRLEAKRRTAAVKSARRAPRETD